MQGDRGLGRKERQEERVIKWVGRRGWEGEEEDQ